MNRHTLRQFTLVEVVIAMGILVLCVTVAMSMVASSQKRMIKAEEKWQKQHLLTQAAEYFLLAPPGDHLPEQIFPFKNYNANCVYFPPEGLPENVNIENGEWRLSAMKITVNPDDSNRQPASIIIERIIKNGDL